MVFCLAAFCTITAWGYKAGEGANDVPDFTEYADLTAFLADPEALNLRHAHIGGRFYPGFRIRAFIRGGNPLNDNTFQREYADEAAYRADSTRTSALFALIGDEVYYIPELELFGFDDSGHPLAGPVPEVPGFNTTAVGDDARAFGFDATAIGQRAEAFEEAVAIGDFSSAQGVDSIAIGDHARVYDRNGIVIGQFAHSAGEDSIAIGDSADVNGDRSVTIGANSIALGERITVLGHGAVAAKLEAGQSFRDIPLSSDPAFAGDVGTLLECAEDNFGGLVEECLSFYTPEELANPLLIADTEEGDQFREGIQARLRGILADLGTNRATAIGTFSRATADRTTAVGYSAKAEATRSTAVGSNSIASGERSAAFGYYSLATSERATALGQYAQAHGDHATAVGSDSVAGLGEVDYDYRNAAGYIDHRDQVDENGERTNPTAGFRNVIIGGRVYAVADLEGVSGGLNPDGSNLPNPLVGAARTTAIGQFARATGEDATAIGQFARATGEDATAIGQGAQATAEAVAVGQYSAAQGRQSIAIGDHTRAYGHDGIAIGQFSHSAGEDSIVLGSNAGVNDDRSVTIGADSIAFGERVTVLGHGAVAAQLEADQDIEDALLPEVNDPAFAGDVGSLLECAYEGEECMPFFTPEELANPLLIADTDEGEQFREGIQARLRGILADLGTDRAIAIGAFSRATASRTTAVGNSARAEAARSTAVGNFSIASGERSAAFGHASHATGDRATAVGANNIASGDRSAAFGHSAIATAQQSTVLGQRAQAHGADGVAVGRRAAAGGLISDYEYFDAAEYLERRNQPDHPTDFEYVIIAGELYRVADLNAVQGGLAADGSNLPNPISGAALATAIGARATADGEGSTALGADASAGGERSIAVGEGAQANFPSSIAIGPGVAATRANQIIIGAPTHTYTFPGLPTPASRAAQNGPLRLVTVDADGNLADDDGDFNKRLGSESDTAATDGSAFARIRQNADDLATEQTERQSAIARIDTTLANLGTPGQGSGGSDSALIAAERTARSQADDALDGRIDDEVTARTEGDEALRTALDTERTALDQADDALGVRIDDEVTARTEGDTRLRTDLGARTDVSSDDRDGSAFARLNSLQDLVDTAAEVDNLGAAQVIERRIGQSDDDTAAAATEETITIRRREVMRPDGAIVTTNVLEVTGGDESVSRRLAYLASLLGTAPDANQPVRDGDGNVVGTTGEQFRAIGEAREEGQGVRAQTQHLFRYLYGDVGADGREVVEGDTENPHETSIVGRIQSVESGELPQAYQTVEEAPELASGWERERRVVVQEVDTDQGGQEQEVRLRTIDLGAIGGLDNRVDGLDQRVSGLNLQVNDLSERVNAGIAMSAALTALPNIVYGGRHSMGIGVGNHAGESAVALGYSGRVGRHAHFNLGIATSGRKSSTTSRAGINWTW